ncbi:hypothetical protein ACFUN8_05950 [Streptomyces sp. NPDC057307]|uniref:hypothetical protein n=1 Tax=Streptomyces sp. NPDC057307 TaxID=3346096 RepID=UPI00362DE694
MQYPEHREKESDSVTVRELPRLVLRGVAVHPAQAWTDVTNIAERRAPEKAGPRRGGVVRGAWFRDGDGDRDCDLYRVAWGDLV